MMTMEEFEKIPAGKIFLTGELPNRAGGLFMGGKTQGELLTWVARKGYAGNWCIYCAPVYYSVGDIAVNGKKVFFENHIRMCVPCDDEVFSRYRCQQLKSNNHEDDG